MSSLFAVVASRPDAVEVWKLATGFEAILIIILFLGWIAAPRSGKRDDEEDETQ